MDLIPVDVLKSMLRPLVGAITTAALTGTVTFRVCQVKLQSLKKMLGLRGSWPASE